MCVRLQPPQFVDIPLAEEDSSDEEYRPDDEEDDETAEDVRLCWLMITDVCVNVLVINYWSMCVDVPGERHGEHNFVSQRKSTEQSGGGQLQPLAGEATVWVVVG